jgi:hypothetical protein
VKPVTSKSLFAIAVLCGIALIAEGRPGPRTLHTTEKSKIHVPAEFPAGLAVIYSNLGPSIDAYNDTFGAVVAGPSSSARVSFSYALPFTPRSDAHVHSIRAALSYDGSGANQFNVSIYSDAGGVPGSILAGPMTIVNLPSFGTCCIVVRSTLETPLAVAAGTQYWIVADTPASGTGSEFLGVWEFVYPTPFTQAPNVANTSWSRINGGYQQPAAAVLGNIAVVI